MQLKPAYNVEDIYTNLGRSNGYDAPPWGCFSGSITVCGNGPSLAEAPKPKGAVAAVNGAFKHLIERGVRPRFAICGDSQAENAAFYGTAPKGTMYLMASRCHPEVFESLAGRNVRVWHVNDAPEWHVIGAGRFITGGATTGLKSLNLLHGLGFDHFNLVGFDSCYRDGKHHASHQPWNDRDKAMIADIGGKKFLTTAWMLEQATQAVQQFTHANYTVSVEGDGLLAHIWKGQMQ